MKDMDPEMQSWVEDHAFDDTMRLRLRYHGNDEISQAILQIECRRKAASKLPEALSCKAFMFPTGLSAEQSTSEALAGIHADIAGYTSGSRHLDLTCGLAIDSLEAARRGADVTAVEIIPEIVNAANHNAAALGLASGFRAIHAESETFIADTPCRFDTIFIDPARRGEGGKRLTAIAECMPDVTTMMPRLLEIAPKVIIKASPMLDITALADELDRSADGAGAVTTMVAIGTTRECKEVVAVVCRGVQRGGYVTEAITSLPASSVTSLFRSDNKADATPCIEGLPCPGDYLYEPYPAVMKLSAWSSIAALDTSLLQLHPNTHLFVSPAVIDSFPGARMVIERVEPLSDKALRSIAREYPKINVSTRNFIISAPELAKRLRVKEGGTMMLYGVRSGDSGAPAIIVAR